VSNTEQLQPKNQKKFVESFCKNISTCCGLGFGYAPGTLGSIFTTLFHYLAVKKLNPNRINLLITEMFFILLFFVLGWIAISVYIATNKDRKDPKEVIIDEVVGQLIALAICHTCINILSNYSTRASSQYLQLFLHASCLLFFRIFDILKPWPISWIDKKYPNPLGIIADDVLAGVFAGLTSSCLIFLIL
jgi:phosphatidylglycerophosphatase A